MLEDFVHIHQEVLSRVPSLARRYLYDKVHWNARGLCILGDRGVGKTTLLCQDLVARYHSPRRALYISADHVRVLSYGLVAIAKEYFGEGGEALYIDEVHKYPNWSLEIKNIIDTYKGRQVLFSASSSLDLQKSKGDLSRRVVYHRLLGLSFREYLEFAHQKPFPVLSLEEILQEHVAIASRFDAIPILQYFREYLSHGYYPFFLEGLGEYFLKLCNVIEKVLFEDVAIIYNLKHTTVPVLKKLLWFIAMSGGWIPNIDKMSKNLGVSREMVYNCLSHLQSAGLLNEVMPSGKGKALLRKPAKVYLHNTNLLHAVLGSPPSHMELGGVRETFFVQQVGSQYPVAIHEKGDFLVADRWIIEVGGKNKNDYQIRGEKEGFWALDDMKMGFGSKIPLYLFGFLY